MNNLGMFGCVGRQGWQLQPQIPDRGSSGSGCGGNLKWQVHAQIRG